MMFEAASQFGTMLGQMLRGDPQKAARLAAESQARALESQRAAEAAAAEAALQRQATFARLRGELKLDNFDGDNGGDLLLKGVDVGPGSAGAIKPGNPGNELGLKLGDDDLKPRGTQAAANSGPPETPAPNADPMVVDLRNLQRSAFLTHSFETAAPADAPLMLDEALRAANGDQSFISGVPARITMPAIDEKGLLAFQQANSDFRRATDFQMKCAQTFSVAQQRRELADRYARSAIDDLEQAKAKLTDEAYQTRKHQLMADIFAATKSVDEAYAKARAEVEAARNRNFAAKEEAVRVMRATAAGKDPASFHPPIASLPGLDEMTWMQAQEKLIASRRDLERQNSDLRTQLKQLNFPVPLTYERMHEGVILGAATDGKDAEAMYSTLSPFSGKTPDEMNAAAARAKQNGIEGLGGAMVVSFGTTKTGTAAQKTVEAGRVVGDHVTTGQVSLNTPEGKEMVAKLSGKEFDRLIAHSNGASITEALIQNDLIKVNELNIVGGDRSLLNGPAFQQLLDSGKVKRVVVWINMNDPVVWGTAADQLKLTERGHDALGHIARKVTGDLAGGDARVEYHFMVGQGKDLTFEPHYLETAYYPNIANELGTPWAFPKKIASR